MSRRAKTIQSPEHLAFRAVQEKEARTKMGLEPQSAEYHRRVRLNALTKEYVMSHHNIPPAIAATVFVKRYIAKCPKPSASMNAVFQKQGKSFRLTLIGASVPPATVNRNRKYSQS